MNLKQLHPKVRTVPLARRCVGLLSGHHWLSPSYQANGHPMHEVRP